MLHCTDLLRGYRGNTACQVTWEGTLVGVPLQARSRQLGERCRAGRVAAIPCRSTRTSRKTSASTRPESESLSR